MKVGILGLGAIAEKMALTIDKMEGVEVEGVAARDINKAVNFAKRFHVNKAYGSYEDLASDANLDLIYIATPHSFHFEHAKMCIEKGRNVLVEKAFTLNETEAQNLLLLAREKKVLICEAMWVRFMPVIDELNKILDSELIGEIVSVNANLGYELTRKERLVEPILGGGALLDLGIYPLTFATMVLGYDVAYISSAVVKLPTGVDAQESIALTFSNGSIAQLYATMLSETDKRGMIYGTKGYIEINNINTYDSISVYDPHGNLIKEVEAPEKISGYEYEVLACKDAIEKGELECDKMDHMTTLTMMRLMDAIRQQWGLVYPGEAEYDDGNL